MPIMKGMKKKKWWVIVGRVCHKRVTCIHSLSYKHCSRQYGVPALLSLAELKLTEHIIIANKKEDSTLYLLNKDFKNEA